jgi:hypothetical protein
MDRHIGRCADCQAKLAGREEAQACAVRTAPSDRPDPIWPAVEARIKTLPAAPKRPSFLLRTLWKPAVGIGAAAAGIMMLIFLVSRPPRPAATAVAVAEMEEFRLDSVEAWGRPAQALFYQARDSGTTIIWVR